MSSSNNRHFFLDETFSASGKALTEHKVNEDQRPCFSSIIGQPAAETSASPTPAPDQDRFPSHDDRCLPRGSVCLDDFEMDIAPFQRGNAIQFGKPQSSHRLDSEDSDVVEFYENNTRYMRVNGVVFEMVTPPNNAGSAVPSQLTDDDDPKYTQPSSAKIEARGLSYPCYCFPKSGEHRPSLPSLLDACCKKQNIINNLTTQKLQRELDC